MRSSWGCSCSRGVCPPPALLSLITRTGAQVVQVGHRDAGEGFERDIAKHVERALGQLLGGRPRKLAVQVVELGQQDHVGRGVALRERLRRRAAPVDDLPALLPLRDQSAQLRPRVARDLAKESPQDALVGSREATVVKLAQGDRQPQVPASASGRFETDGAAAGEKDADLVQRLQGLRIQGHDRPPRMTPARKARLMCHWKRLGVDDLVGALHNSAPCLRP